MLADDYREVPNQHEVTATESALDLSLKNCGLIKGSKGSLPEHDPNNDGPQTCRREGLAPPTGRAPYNWLQNVLTIGLRGTTSIRGKPGKNAALGRDRLHASARVKAAWGL